LWIPVVAVASLLAIANYAYIDIFDKVGVDPGVMPVASAGAVLAVGYFLREKQYGWAFVMMGLTILLSVATFFWFLHPNVMVSSTNEAFNLTVSNAAASNKTLELMTIVALVFVPVVVLYQGWSYRVFRQRVSAESELHY
jgi:cytochrome d ubiquinol oxidase subunit II